jgi:hypothetical protein
MTQAPCPGNLVNIDRNQNPSPEGHALLKALAIVRERTTKLFLSTTTLPTTTTKTNSSENLVEDLVVFRDVRFSTSCKRFLCRCLCQHRL